MEQGVALGLEEALKILAQTRQLLRDDEAATFAQFAETKSDDPAAMLVNSERWLQVKAFGREFDEVQRALTGMLDRAHRPLPTGVESLYGTSAWSAALASEGDGARRETLQVK